MKIKLVSHASVMIECSDLQIWTDPWLFGKVFNDSWTLFPAPAFEESMLDDVKYIWISHEHPDHFHIPTLRSLPRAFKEHVIIMFQRKNTDKIVSALKNLGFHHFLELPHRKPVNLTSSTKVYCYQVGVMDSCLAVLNNEQVVLNVNDASISARDCKIMLSELGRVDIVLNQFSIAGYNGYKDRKSKLPFYSRQILKNIERDHQHLNARVTIPIASFVYFSTSDNRYMNDYMNTPGDVYNQLGEKCAVVFPGKTYDLNRKYDSSESLKMFDAEFGKVKDLPYDEVQKVKLEEIRNGFAVLANQIHDRYPKLVLFWLGPVSVNIRDLGVTIRFSIYNKTFEESAGCSEPDLIVNSQPLLFAFKFPFGVQTLGVSARFTIQHNFRNWRWHRILFSLNNAEIYLKCIYIFSRANFLYMVKRFPGGISQVYGKLQRMR